MLSPLLPRGSLPDELLLSDPGAVTRLHKAYAEAGADIVTTDTFCSGRIQLARHGLEGRQAEIVDRAVRAARDGCRGSRTAVAGSIGPLGDFLLPFGPLATSEALDCFRGIARLLVCAGVDLISIETMTDIRELRLAVMAVRELDRSIPILMQMSFSGSARTVTGTPAGVLSSVAAAWGPGAAGLNCGDSIESNLEALRELVRTSPLPVAVQSNAGLPVQGGDCLSWPAGPAGMAAYAEKAMEIGASVIGSCCGSTPECTAAIAAAVRGRPVRKRSPAAGFVASSRFVFLPVGPGHPFRPVGERINPTGRRKLADSVARGALPVLKAIAAEQTSAGAEMLDFNIGTGDPAREREFVPLATRALENITQAPLLFDSSDEGVLDAGMAEYAGRPVVNSIPGIPDRLERELELAARHGAAAILLLIGPEGVPGSATGRLRLLDGMLETAHRNGLGSSDILIDPVVMAEASSPGSARITNEVIREIRDMYRLPTIIGLSNCSFGLPGRRLLNRAFLAGAIQSGLSAAILDPLDPGLMSLSVASGALTGDAEALSRFVSSSRGGGRQEDTAPPGSGREQTLLDAVLAGDPEAAARLAASEAEGPGGRASAARSLLEASRELGRRYEAGSLFLPTLIAGAETVRMAFASIGRSGGEGAVGRIVLATVRGDVHDIGKNIVASVLEGHGWEVVDLGRDVPAEAIVSAVSREKPDVVGLSALLTPSLPVLRSTVALLRSASGGGGPAVIVGGAVITEEFAAEIGALYGKDAVAAARVLEGLLASRAGPGGAGSP